MEFIKFRKNLIDVVYCMRPKGMSRYSDNIPRTEIGKDFFCESKKNGNVYKTPYGCFNNITLTEEEFLSKSDKLIEYTLAKSEGTTYEYLSTIKQLTAKLIEKKSVSESDYMKYWLINHGF